MNIPKRALRRRIINISMAAILVVSGLTSSAQVLFASKANAAADVLTAESVCVGGKVTVNMNGSNPTSGTVYATATANGVTSSPAKVIVSGATAVDIPVATNQVSIPAGTANLNVYFDEALTGTPFEATANYKAIDCSYANIYASNSGNDSDNGTTPSTAFASLQKAINTVAAGGTVHIANGTYTEKISFTKGNMTVVGESKAGTVIVPLNNEYGQGFTSENYGDLNIGNLTISTNSPVTNGGSAVKFHNAQNITLHDVVVTGGSAYLRGVDVNGVSNFKLDNVSVSGFGKNGIAITSKYAQADAITSKDVTFNNVSTTNNGWSGIAFYTVGGGNASADITGVKFSGTNTISNNAQNGIFFEGGTDGGAAAHTTPTGAITGTAGDVNLAGVTFAANALSINNYQTKNVLASAATFNGKLGTDMNAAEIQTVETTIIDHNDFAVYGDVIIDTVSPIASFYQVQPPAVVSGSFATRLVVLNEAGIISKTISFDTANGLVCATDTSDHVNLDATCNTSALTEGTHKLVGVVIDESGNRTEVTSDNFIVDRTNPTITVKSGSNFTTGSNNTFSKVSFALYDQNKVVKYSINGVMHTVTPNDYSDANFITTGDGSGAVYGTNNFVLYDAAGNTATYSFVMDNVGPTVTVKNTSTGSDNVYSKIDLKLYDTYNVSSYTVNGGSVHTLTPNDYSDANDISVGGNGGINGLNTIVVKDVAGNSTSFQFVLDNVKPVITVKSNPDTIGSNGVYSKLSLALFDTKGIASYKLNNGQIFNLTHNQYSDVNDITVGSYHGATLGNNTITVYDIAGNAQTLSFVLDNVAPSKPVLALPSNGSYLKTNDFDFDWNDSTDDSALTYEFQSSQDPSRDSNQVLNGSNIWHSNVLSTSMIHSSGAGDGPWFYQVRAKDAAGNYSQWSDIWAVIIDTVSPVAPTLNSPLNNSVVNGASVTQSWNPSTSTDVDHYVYESFNDAAMNSPRFSDTYTGTSKTATNIADGTVYYWHVKAVDHAGNVSGVSPLWKITIDNTAPSAPVVTATGVANNATTNSSSVEINWTKPSADTAKYDYRVWTNAAGSQYNSEATAYVANNLTDLSRTGAFTEGEGSYFIQVRAIDAANNVSNWSNTFTVIYDHTAPVLTLNDVISNFLTTRTFTGTTEPGALVNVTVHSTPQTKAATVDSNGNWTVTFADLEVGSHTVEATSKDAAGNTLTSSTKNFEVTAVPAAVAPASTSATIPTVSTNTPTNNQNLVAVNNAATATDDTQPTATTDNGEVLGTQDTKKNVASIAGVEKSTNGTANVFGIAWYWILLALAAIAAAWWLIAAYRRRQQENA